MKYKAIILLFALFAFAASNANAQNEGRFNKLMKKAKEIGDKPLIPTKTKKISPEELAKVKFPEAGTLNQQEPLRAFAFTELTKLLNKDGQELMAFNLESNDWNIVHHKTTGLPVYRWAKGAFAQKNKDGSCMLQGYFIKQQYNGADYSNTTFGGVIHGQMPYGQYMACENVPAK